MFATKYDDDDDDNDNNNNHHHQKDDDDDDDGGDDDDALCISFRRCDLLRARGVRGYPRLCPLCAADITRDDPEEGIVLDQRDQRDDTADFPLTAVAYCKDCNSFYGLTRNDHSCWWRCVAAQFNNKEWTSGTLHFRHPKTALPHMWILRYAWTAFADRGRGGVVPKQRMLSYLKLLNRGTKADELFVKAFHSDFTSLRALRFELVEGSSNLTKTKIVILKLPSQHFE